MPRIPVIEQTTNVSTSTPTTQAQGMPVVSALGNAGAAAVQGFDDLAKGEVIRQNALYAKESADAIANTGKPLSDADVYWTEYLSNASKNTVDGGMVKNADGSTVGFRQKAQEDFDKWSTGFMSGITNEKAKIYAENHLNRLRTQTLDGAIRYEAMAGIANRAQKVDEAVSTWASAAAKDDSGIQQLVLSAKTMIANSGFDERTRNEKAQKAVEQIVEAGIRGNIERDPNATRAALIARYGVDPTAPVKLPGAAPTGAPAALAPAVAKYNPVIQQAAQAKGVDPTVMAFQIQKESGGNPNAQNNADIRVTGSPSIGIAQFQPATARRYGIDPKNPEQSIAGQAAYMSDLLKMFGGDYQKALAGYNWGEGNVQKAVQKYGDQWMQHAPSSTQEYVGTILTNAGRAPAGAGRGNINPPMAGQPQPAQPAYSPALGDLVQQLPAEKLPAFISAATTQANQQQSLFKSQLATTEGDHVAAFMNGQTVARPLAAEDYTRAYGLTEGAQRYANYQSIQQLGNDMTSMKAMPPEQMLNLAERYKPDPNVPGYELANRRYNTILQAVDQVNKARQDDPIAYAMQNGIGGAQPLNFQDPQAFTAELAKRQGVAETMQSTYAAPYSLLTVAEAKTLNKGFEGMTTQQKMGYLNSIKSSIADPVAYRSIMQQIAPDSPVTAMAGMILSKQQPVVQSNMFSADTVYTQQDVAGIMLEGEALINPTKGAKGEDGKGKTFPMPKEQDIRDQFNSVVGKAFAADPRGADFAYQAVKAYYAGKSARAGDVSGQTDSARLKEAVIAVTGGVSDINGNGDVLRPWGMGEAKFKDSAKVAFDAAMLKNGYSGSAIDVFGTYGLQSAGDSKYMLRSGTGYLTDRGGNPIILDLTPAPSYVNQIPSNIPSGPTITAPATVVQPKTNKPVTQQPKTK